jgi:hypothetical protein
MKTLGTILVAVLLSCTCVVNAQIHFGVKAGINNSTMSISGNAVTSSVRTEMLPTTRSYMIGGFADIPLMENVTLQPNLIISGKGVKMSEAYTVINEELTATYVEIPVYLSYKTEEIDGIKVICSAGPYLGMGMSGKIVMKDPSGNKLTHTIKWGSNSSSDLKKLDFGFSFILGWEFKYGIQFLFIYNLGLNNLVPTESIGSNLMKITNSSVGISLGYMIN